MSTIQVDRIIPYQSASVTVEGLSAPNLATTGSNTFVGDQNIQGTLTASIQEGFVLAGGAGDVSVLVATSSFGGGGDTTELNAFTASQEVLNATFATTGSNTFNGDQVVQGTDKQTFSDPGDNQEVKTISVNSFVDSQGYTMGINTFGWYHFNSEGHQGFSSNLWTSDYAYGGAWFHDPNKFEYILFPSGAAYDSNTFGLYDNGDTTTKFRVLTDKIELTGSAELSGSLSINNDIFVSSSDIFLTGSAGSFINIFSNVPSAIRFYSGSTIDETGRGGQIKVAGGNSINIGSFGDNETSLVDFDFNGLQTLFSRNVQVVGNSTLNISSGSSIGNYRHNGITFTKTSATASFVGGDNVQLTSNTRYTANLQSLYGFEHFNGNTNAYINLNIDNAAYGNSGWAGPGLAVANSDATDYPVVIGLQSGPDYTDGTVTILKPLDVSGSVSITDVIQLAGQDPLPAGGVGQLAVSSSGDLYYHNGVDWQLK
jgi:hypothetical protein